MDMDLKVGGKVFQSRGPLEDKFNWPCAVLVAVQRLTLGVGAMFSFWNDLLWEQPPPRWGGRELPRRSGSLSSQGLPVPTLLLYLSPLLLRAASERKAFDLLSRVRGLPLQCLTTTTTLILHFKWGSKCFTRMLFKEGSRAGRSLLRRLSILVPVYLATNQYSRQKRPRRSSRWLRTTPRKIFVDRRRRGEPSSSK